MDGIERHGVHDLFIILGLQCRVRKTHQRRRQDSSTTSKDLISTHILMLTRKTALDIRMLPQPPQDLQIKRRRIVPQISTQPTRILIWYPPEILLDPRALLGCWWSLRWGRKRFWRRWRCCDGSWSRSWSWSWGWLDGRFEVFSLLLLLCCHLRFCFLFRSSFLLRTLTGHGDRIVLIIFSSSLTCLSFLLLHRRRV